MIRIAQAASSETFGKYGTAPNQRRTGVTKEKPGGNLDGELNIINWRGGWEAVYRPLDPAVAEFIADFFYKAVANGSGIGYSWTGNTGLFDWLKNHNSKDPGDVNTPVNTDCTALAGAAVYNAGIHDDKLRTMTTSNMDAVLMGTNAFLKLSGKDLCEKGKGIQRGDLLWRTGHAACTLDSDPDYSLKPTFYFQKYSFNGTNITAGTPGTRAVQRTRSVAKNGYRIVDARLSYVSNSAIANVVPFFGYGDEDRLCVNFYRAGTSGTIDATIVVVYVREELTGASW